MRHKAWTNCLILKTFILIKMSRSSLHLVSRDSRLHITYLSKVDHVSDWCARWSVWVINWKSRLLKRKSKNANWINTQPNLQQLLHWSETLSFFVACSDYASKRCICKSNNCMVLTKTTDRVKRRIKGATVNPPYRPKVIPLKVF